MGLGTPVTMRYLTSEDYPAWERLVADSPDGSIYSLPRYLDALCEATGGNYRILAAERDGRLTGGIALYREKSPVGAFVSPRLLLYYNGLVLAPHAAKSPAQRTEWQLRTLDALERVLAGLSLARLRIKSRSTLMDLRIFAARGWSLRPTWSYVIDLSDLSAAWSRMHKDQRRLVERCRERGLQLTVDDDFDAFYRLHRQTHLRKRAPLYLAQDVYRRFVASLQDGGLARLYHARLPGGRVLASQLVLTGLHPVTHTVCAAADGEFLRLGASAFLRWAVCEDLAGAGYLANDLTDAELNPVTRFKSQLGGDLVLSLQISRRDSLLFGASRLAAAIPGRVKRRLLRMLYAAQRSKSQVTR